MKLPLEDVTLVYISDAEDIPVSTLAVQDNMRVANFGDVLLFSDVPWDMPGTTNIGIAPLRSDVGTDPVHAIGAAMCCLWYTVPKHITTKYALIAQWDSWIINPSRWTPDYLAYDYIGGPWRRKDGKYEVGNGGFSIRSTRLMKYVAAHPDLYPLTYPRFEDGILCRDHRAALEEEGFTWAPVKLAAEFSFEGAGDPCFDMHNPNYLVDLRTEKPFGFHSIRNWHRVMSREACLERLNLVRSKVRQSKDWMTTYRATQGMPRTPGFTPAITRLAGVRA